MDWGTFLHPQVLVFMIPISAIVCGCSVTIAKMYFSHQERIELIRQGIHPDHQVSEGSTSQVETDTAEYSMS